MRHLDDETRGAKPIQQRAAALLTGMPRPAASEVAETRLEVEQEIPRARRGLPVAPMESITSMHTYAKDGIASNRPFISAPLSFMSDKGDSRTETDRPFSECIACDDSDRYTAVVSRGTDMATLTIRNLDPTLKERLRVRAAEHGHSMEAEARRILQSTLKPERPTRNLYERIRARFAPFGGVDDLEVPPREAAREPPRFG